MSLNLQSLVTWGLLATGVLTLISSGGQQLGLSRMSLPFMLGTIFTARRRLATIVGFGAHFLLGIVFAVLYALVFEGWHHASWWAGALLGAFHGLFLLVVGISVLPSIHPRMSGKHRGPTPTRQLEPPGLLALHYGAMTPAVAMVAHVVYGAILGGFYELA
jgi:hypothetical protein